jgi:hypothetical protein
VSVQLDFSGKHEPKIANRSGSFSTVFPPLQSAYEYLCTSVSLWFVRKSAGKAVKWKFTIAVQKLRTSLPLVRKLRQIWPLSTAAIAGTQFSAIPQFPSGAGSHSSSAIIAENQSLARLGEVRFLTSLNTGDSTESARIVHSLFGEARAYPVRTQIAMMRLDQARAMKTGLQFQKRRDAPAAVGSCCVLLARATGLDKPAIAFVCSERSK